MHIDEIEVQTLVDTGAQVCLIDETIVQKLNLPTKRGSGLKVRYGNKQVARVRRFVEIALRKDQYQCVVQLYVASFPNDKILEEYYHKGAHESINWLVRCSLCKSLQPPTQFHVPIANVLIGGPEALADTDANLTTVLKQVQKHDHHHRASCFKKQELVILMRLIADFNPRFGTNAFGSRRQHSLSSCAGFRIFKWL